MSETAVDFAIFGSDPLALLLAGLLGKIHRQRVVLIGTARPAFRLAQAVDLSIGPVTRPETWALLAGVVPETMKLLVRIGANTSLIPVNPILFADTAAGKQALPYIRHTALGFGQSVDRYAAGALGGQRDAIQFRDAFRLDPVRLEPPMAKWLSRSKVIRLALADVSATFEADGSARIVSGERTITASRAILANDAAILTLVPVNRRAGVLVETSVTSILTEPTAPLSSSVMVQVDAGIVLTQAGSKAIAGLAVGSPDTTLAKIGALLANHEHLRLAGQAEFIRLHCADGGSYFGQIGGDGPYLIGGISPIGAFIAPALARWFAGNATASESAYFTARGGRDHASPMVSELSPVIAA